MGSNPFYVCNWGICFVGAVAPRQYILCVTSAGAIYLNNDNNKNSNYNNSLSLRRRATYSRRSIFVFLLSLKEANIFPRSFLNLSAYCENWYPVTVLLPRSRASKSRVTAMLGWWTLEIIKLRNKYAKHKNKFVQIDRTAQQKISLFIRLNETNPKWTSRSLRSHNKTKLIWTNLF